MLRRCLPESRPAQHTCVLPQCGRIPTPKRSCWPVLGAALLCVLRLAWTAPGYAAQNLLVSPTTAPALRRIRSSDLSGLARLSRRRETLQRPGSHGAALDPAWQGLGHV